jgi:hypothetical protein
VSAVPALAASKNGITPTAPRPGSTVDVGSRPTFNGKVKGAGTVWVYVSTSRKTDKEGVIDNDQMIQKARKQNGRFSTKARFFDFPEFWLNTPGTYYWQAHRIACGEDGGDCLQEGPIVKFKVG